MPWANRFQNCEAHLITPGRLNAAGISRFGSSCFLDGFNEKITWRDTFNWPNIVDIYEERIDPQDPSRYLHKGEWRPIRAETGTFRINGPRGVESVTLPLHLLVIRASGSCGFTHSRFDGDFFRLRSNRRLSESHTREALPRSEPIPSKNPIRRQRK
jgi:acyl-homoserine lactone acylase PvdQ